MSEIILHKSFKYDMLLENYFLHHPCWKQLCCLIFLFIHSFQYSLTNRKFKRTAFIWNRNFMSLMSLLINLMHPCWIKKNIYFFNIIYPQLLNSKYIYTCKLLLVRLEKYLHYQIDIIMPFLGHIINTEYIWTACHLLSLFFIFFFIW